MVELWPHQKKALEELKNGSILAGDVGSGKSLTALAYFIAKVCGGSIDPSGRETPLATPVDLYIITTAKKRDDLEWDKECAIFSLSRHEGVSRDGITVTIDSWQNIKKYKEVKNAFFIFDEQHLVGRGVWVSSFLDISRTNQWVLLSGTPGDNWSDYIPVFIAHGFYRNRTDFNDHHVVFNNRGGYPKIDKYVYTKRLERLRSEILVDMPYHRHTTRHREYILVPYDKEKFRMVDKQRWNIYLDEPIENASQMYVLLRRVVNSEEERLKQILDLTTKHPRLIIFYNYNYELAALKTLAEKVSFPVAEYNGSRHDPIPDSKRWLYLVQYTSGSEGWNCVSTNAMVFYSLNHSYRVMEQSEGRTDRLNTPFTDLYYYAFLTDSWIDRSIMRALKAKKDFNLAAFGRRYDFPKKDPSSKKPRV